MTAEHPSVLFVCVKNAGKSQMAAALMRARAGEAVTVHSAGTAPGSALNAESVASLAEIGASTEGEYAKGIDPAVLAGVDRVVIVGAEAEPALPPGTPVERWETDEPSLRDITGAERMNLIRDELRTRVEDLYQRMAPPDRG